MIVLGIETSCDETAAAIVSDDRRIHANLVLSQIEEHRPYLGVVPEIAARAHIAHLDRLIKQAMTMAGIGFGALDGIAVTAGPGLIGGLIVGVTIAKAIAAVAAKPLVAINHLEGHALSIRLGREIGFPYLLLLVSGGHCQLLAVEGVGCYRLYGTTVDDAVGEAFDKVAKLLDLGYPGGPAVEQAARAGDAARFALPRPMLGRPGADFSFSGLKTAVRHAYSKARPDAVTEQERARLRCDLAASFQAAVVDSLADRTQKAIRRFRSHHPAARHLAIAGGVAANQAIRDRLATLAESARLDLAAPSPAFCTDNGAMIAWAGVEKISNGLANNLEITPRPRWPLDPARVPGAIGQPLPTPTETQRFGFGLRHRRPTS